jgi:hypothetical protein
MYTLHRLHKLGSEITAVAKGVNVFPLLCYYRNIGSANDAAQATAEPALSGIESNLSIV